MPRKRVTAPSDKERVDVDCVSFLPAIGDKRAACRALKEVYCLFEDKPCKIRAVIERPTESDLQEREGTE